MAQVARKRRAPVLQGVLPIDRARVPADVIAGVTLAALGIPEVMGYTTIAGMPVITGLYTILIPIAVFAVLGSSRHLVVGADSASAAMMAAGIAGLAPVASPHYVSIAGIVAIATGAFLLLARIVRLGFLADFLSRSVLIGFLTGVGIQVAMEQVAGMFGVPEGTGRGPIAEFIDTLTEIPSQTSWTTAAVSASVLGVIVGLKAITPKIPGALIAVVGAITASYLLDLQDHGVAVLGHVPSGLPSFGLPDFGWSDLSTIVATAASIFLVVLAQSAATSRAYAAKYGDRFDENVDLVGLAAANASAGLSGTFVVNGSPTKTQMVDGAGGRSQLAQLTTAVIVLLVLLFLTKPLAYMPQAVLSSIVFLIGIELIDLAGMRTIWQWRKDEFVVAAITALTVVTIGVEQGILLAIVLSLIDHVRKGYHPRDTVLVRDGAGHWTALPVPDPDDPELPAATTDIAPGLVVYRFGAALFYANTNQLSQEIRALLERPEGAPECLVMDLASVPDVDFSGGETLFDLAKEVGAAGSRLVLVQVDEQVHAELERYGLLAELGDGAVMDTVEDAVEAFGARPPAPPSPQATP